MTIRRHFTITRVGLASAVLATLSLVACNQSQPPTAAPASPESKATATAAPTKEVYVIFEGPWAIAGDPKDANNILLLAPKTKHHRDLYVTASNHSTLASGTYDLSFPGHVGPGAGAFDPAILRAKIDPKDAQHVLDSKAVRYAIRLPRPDAYLPSHRHRARAGSTYPPDVSTEKEYATAVSLRYSVSSLSGFSLSGTPDSGTFNPLLLQVDTPAIRFVIEPTEDDDRCNTHSRQAFHDLVQLVGLTLYIDFADNPSDCHDKDPQVPHGGKAHAGLASSVERIAALLTGNLADVQAADGTAGEAPSRYFSFIAKSTIARKIAQRLGAFIYLFGTSGVDCRGIVIGDD
ncbi:MAG: hypothetical protein ABSG07_02165 [Terriglobales bacterium]|jgi:hypothetical protein